MNTVAIADYPASPPTHFEHEAVLKSQALS